jgi:Fe2+ or Zn2+ uptake regulation protein
MIKKELARIYPNRLEFLRQNELAHANGDSCQDSTCQECCPHDEHDHAICIDCGYDMTDDLASYGDHLADIAQGK